MRFLCTGKNYMYNSLNQINKTCIARFIAAVSIRILRVAALNKINQFMLSPNAC